MTNAYTDDTLTSEPQMMTTDDDQTKPDIRPDARPDDRPDHRQDQMSTSKDQSSQQSQSSDAESSVADEEERSVKRIRREAKNKTTKESLVRKIKSLEAELKK
jgi:hypothetical protein